jgi:hypothetical protein
MMLLEYVRQHYSVPAEIGRRVTVYGKYGVIVADRGHYIGVNFDDDKPSVIRNAHPTTGVVYGDMGKVRKQSRYAARYKRFLEYGDSFNSFIDFCRWDADSARSWNTRI